MDNNDPDDNYDLEQLDQSQDSEESLSDNSGSIQSVVHVGSFESPRVSPCCSNGSDVERHIYAEARHPEDSSSDESDGKRRNSDSSSSSENTQIWISQQKQLRSHNQLMQKFQRHASNNLSTSSVMRNSMISCNSSTGRIEVTLHEEHGNGVDSGISGESHGDGGSSGQGDPTLLPGTQMPPPSPPMMSILKGNESQNQCTQSCAVMEAHLRNSLLNVTSGSYALFLIVLGLVLSLAETSDWNSQGNYEGFYIFLYVVAIVFLGYAFGILLRARAERKRRRKWAHDDEATLDSALLTKTKHVTISGVVVRTGSFYLRLGAVGLGIGAMIHEGLKFGEMFQVDVFSPCFSSAQAVSPIIHLIFIFAQLYFIFLNSKMYLHNYSTLARFGLMHMIATNVCIWIRTVFDQVLRDFDKFHAHQKHHFSVEPSILLSSATQNSSRFAAYPLENDTNRSTTVNCTRHDIISHVVARASPFLYPCTVQYCFIAGAILIVLWKNIGRRLEIIRPSTPSASSHRRIGVDCGGATRGLFLGVLVLVLIIISTIVHVVMSSKLEFQNIGDSLSYGTEVMLQIFCSLAICFAWFRMRDMKFDHRLDNSLDEGLLLVSLSFVYILSVFGIVTGQSRSSSLLVASSTLSAIESSLQTAFIFHALRRSSLKPYHETKKPGRQYVTFLLIANVAACIMCGVQGQRMSLDNTTFDPLPSIIVRRCSLPFVTFYRLHSAICLANVWKNAYKLKRD